MFCDVVLCFRVRLTTIPHPKSAIVILFVVVVVVVVVVVLARLSALVCLFPSYPIRKVKHSPCLGPNVIIVDTGSRA